MSGFFIDEIKACGYFKTCLMHTLDNPCSVNRFSSHSFLPSPDWEAFRRVIKNAKTNSKAS
jgi:hypothetical protein